MGLYSRRGFINTQTTPQQGALADHSGTIAVANTSEEAVAADANRTYILIQNIDDKRDLWVNFGAAATAGDGSFVLSPGGALTFEGNFCPTGTVNVLCSHLIDFTIKTFSIA
jgi:hypothetical protein